MDCVYDLNITIIDAACGNTLFNQSKVIGGSTLDTLCNHSGLDSIGTSNIKLNLTPGSYQIIKTLVVNEAAVEWYTDEYIERNECLLSFNDFYQSILDSTNFSGCNTSPCEVSCLQSLGSREDYIALGHTAQEWDYLYQQCIQSCLDTNTSYCQSYEDQMLADMMPGGQYGLVINTSGTYTATDALSIYNSSNQLPNTAADWRNPTTDYVNEDGTLSYIYNSSGVLVQPEDASITLTEFITNFRPSWAKSLLNYHPERCYLNFCETQTPSHQVDAMMMNTPTYAQALVKGYLNPLHMYLNQGVPDVPPPKNPSE
jgi:hypothetical protein